jgi:hypothetical protein
MGPRQRAGPLVHPHPPTPVPVPDGARGCTVTLAVASRVAFRLVGLARISTDAQLQHPCLRPVLPPRRRPGRHPGPAERSPGPGRPARTRRPGPDGHHHRSPVRRHDRHPALLDPDRGPAARRPARPRPGPVVTGHRPARAHHCGAARRPHLTADRHHRLQRRVGGHEPCDGRPAGPIDVHPSVTAQAEWLHALCASWPHDPGVSGTVRTTVPVVFLNGTADPADPPANVAAAPRTMPNALRVSVPGGAHGVVTTGCVLTQTTAFIQAGMPANRAGWAACTRALLHELPAFPPAP